jgi:hypothetical protein
LKKVEWLRCSLVEGLAVVHSQGTAALLFERHWTIAKEQQSAIVNYSSRCRFSAGSRERNEIIIIHAVHFVRY